VIVAEQKARAVYDNILRVSDDPDVNEVIKFLRQREVVHFQRFGEANHTDLSRFSLQYPVEILCMPFRFFVNYFKAFFIENTSGYRYHTLHKS
jgi:Mn-containing catalase